MTGSRSIVADVYTYVVGVDTHASTHHYALIEARTGGLVDDAEFPTHTAGLLRAVEWIARRTGESTGGDVAQVLISIEGTRSYGARLATLLTRTGSRHRKERPHRCRARCTRQPAQDSRSTR